MYLERLIKKGASCRVSRKSVILGEITCGQKFFIHFSQTSLLKITISLLNVLSFDWPEDLLLELIPFDI